MKRRILKLGVLAVLVGAGGAVALAHGAGGFHHGFWKAKVDEHIDGALDAAKASPAQREAVHAARDHVYATFEESHKDKGARIAKAIALFESERVDPAAVEALRAEHRAEAKQVGDAVVQALTDAHDALTAEQRKAVVEYARAHRPPMMAGGKMEHGQWMKRIATNRIDAALDAANASGAQRATIAAARDRVYAAFEAEHENPGARFYEALELFGEDQLDATKVAALRTLQEERAAKLGDTVVQAVIEAHDALSEPQRRAVGEFVRAHHPDPARSGG